MPTYPHAQALRTAIAEELTHLRGDLDASAAQSAADGGSDATARRFGRPVAPTPAAREIVEQIDHRIERLEQVRDWIDEDEHLAHLIDSVIGKQVRASERRQARFNVLLNVIFLLAGWLLSLAGTPANLIQSLAHH